ncbi:MAG: hypothetical protein Q4C70_05180 [Planctomycetia bacterium]|nr:hypothetical protein [Planctomycetia bacterium]
MSLRSWGDNILNVVFSPDPLKESNCRTTLGGPDASRFATRNDGEMKHHVASVLKVSKTSS